jgi:hypothetical protein
VGLGSAFAQREATLSEFEFVLVTIAIIAGFAISEILAGWSRSLLARGKESYSGLRLLASVFLLFLTLRYIWTLWGVRASEWQFVHFVLILAPMLMMALAAYVISIPADASAIDSTEIYFARARPFFLLQVGVLTSWTLYEWVNLTVIQDTYAVEVNWAVIATRCAGIPAFLWLAFTKRRSHHWVVLGGAIGSLVYLSLESLPAL